MVPKAEIHCHIEGAAHPELVLEKARKYNIDVSSVIDDNHAYQWHDFTSFLQAYDLASSVLKTPEDYCDLAEDTFRRMALDGCIYGEVFTSPDHGKRIGLSYLDMTDAIAEGIEAARHSHGIEGRIIATGVRHEGVEAVEAAAKDIVANPHPMVTGFGMGGDERFGQPKDFARAYAIAKDAGLGLTGHAGEFGGPESVSQALDHWGITRVGHGVRSSEDPNLVKRIADEGITLEICPGSNISLNVYDSFASHPFRMLDEAGCIVTLNSDDPPYFHTTMAREYEIAGREFGYSDDDLLRFTTNAIHAAFVDGETRDRLLEKCVLVAVK